MCVCVCQNQTKQTYLWWSGTWRAPQGDEAYFLPPVSMAYPSVLHQSCHARTAHCFNVIPFGFNQFSLFSPFYFIFIFSIKKLCGASFSQYRMWFVWRQWCVSHYLLPVWLHVVSWLKQKKTNTNTHLQWSQANPPPSRLIWPEKTPLSRSSP